MIARVSALVFRGVLLPTTCLWACGGESGLLGGSPDNPGEQSPLGQVLRAGHGAASATAEDARSGLTVAVQAVVEASTQAGQLTTQGRLVQDAPGGAFRFEPSTDGRMFVGFFDPDGNRQEFFFSYLRVDGQGQTADDILGNNHDLEVRIESPDGQVNVTIRSVRQGARVNATVVGTATRDGVTFEVNLTAVEDTLIREIDTSGSHFRNQSTLQGTMTAADLLLTANQSFEFELVTTRGVTSSSGTSANTSGTRIQHTLQHGGDEYRWEGVQIRRNFRDGTISEADTFWRAEGQVLRNGQPFGRYMLDAELVDRRNGRGFLHVDLHIPNEVVRVETWGQLQ